MKAKLLLRIAAVFILIHLLGHSLGHMTWDKQEDPKMQEVVNAMLGYKTEFMGATKSMADYFNGFSLILFFVFGLSICVLWFASGFINDQKQIAKKILYPFGIMYLAFAVIEIIYFFPFAASISAGAGILIFTALLTLKEN
jgi:hypothetical protein